MDQALPARPQPTAVAHLIVILAGVGGLLSFLLRWMSLRLEEGQDVTARGYDLIIGRTFALDGTEVWLGSPSLILPIVALVLISTIIAALVLPRLQAVAIGMIGFGLALLLSWTIVLFYSVSTPTATGVGAGMALLTASLGAGVAAGWISVGRDWREAVPAGVRPYVEPAPLSALFLGISSGFPFAMIGATLTSRLAQEGITKSTVTAFALTFLAYNLKWAWAPIVDKFRVPILGAIGQRRSWLIVAGAMVAGSVALLGSLDPTTALQWVVVAAIMVGVSGATFDIVIDAYRIELLEPRQLGVGSGMSQYGWRIGSAAAGALALVVAEGAGWTAAYLACTVFALPAIVTGLVMGEPRRRIERDWPRYLERRSYLLFLAALPVAYALAALLDWLLEVQILTVMVMVGIVFPLFDLSARRARTIGWSGRVLWLLVPPLAALLLVLGTGGVDPADAPQAPAGAPAQAVAVELGTDRVTAFDAVYEAFFGGWGAAPARLTEWAAAGGLNGLSAWLASWGGVLIGLLLLAGALLIGFLAGAPRRAPAEEKGVAADPFGEFFARRGAWLVLLFVLVHKIGDTLANLTLRLLFEDLGFTLNEIAFYDVGVGFVALIVGVFVGGMLYSRIGMKWSVMISLALMAVSNLSFAALAAVGHSNAGMAGAMFFENFASGIGGVAVVAYLSALCSLTFTATQYAMLSAAASVLGRLLAGTASGTTIEAIGYIDFYLITTAAALPGILIFWIMMATGLVDDAMGDAGKVGEGDARAEKQPAT